MKYTTWSAGFEDTALFLALVIGLLLLAYVVTEVLAAFLFGRRDKHEEQKRSEK